MITTDFQDWLGNLDNNDIETINCLYESVSGITEIGVFNSTKKNNVLLVKSDYSEQVLELTDRKTKLFLQKLDNDFKDEFSSVRTHYEFVRSMRKND